MYKRVQNTEMIGKNKSNKAIPGAEAALMVQAIYKCKWSLTVYLLLKNGVNRPGEMVRNTEGLSAKVLNDCLKKNIEFGILDKKIYHELPPRVEYSFTDFGRQLTHIIDQLENLNKAM